MYIDNLIDSRKRNTIILIFQIFQLPHYRGQIIEVVTLLKDEAFIGPSDGCLSHGSKTSDFYSGCIMLSAADLEL